MNLLNSDCFHCLRQKPTSFNFSIIPQKLPEEDQPAVTDDRRIQLQREEVLAEHSGGTACVDVQQNQRRSQGTHPRPADSPSLVHRERGRGEGRRRGGGGGADDSQQQRCQPPAGRSWMCSLHLGTSLNSFRGVNADHSRGLSPFSSRSVFLFACLTSPPQLS